MPSFERCVVFEFDCKNDFYEPVTRQVVAELMGRSANLILTENGRIIDAVRRSDLSGGRTVLPSAPFEPAPPQDKLPFTELTDTSVLLANPDITLDKAIMNVTCGISPLNAREIAYLVSGVSGRTCGELSLGERARLDKTVKAVLESIENGDCTPTLVTEKESGRLIDFSFMPIRQYGAFAVQQPLESPSAAVEAFFGQAAKKTRFEQKTRDLSQLLTRLSARVSRTMAVREKELADSEKADKYRVYGELINANLHRLKNGMTEFTAENYYDGMKPIRIPLRAELTPAQNAQAYFKKYVKARNSAGILTKLIASDRTELAYLESVFLALCDCESVKEAEEIRAELVAGGYIKKGARRAAVKPSEPLRLEKDGFEILVGRNNMQNDLVTVRLSRKDDIWLHTKAVHSSHVLIRCRGETPPDAVIEYAARVCAAHSKAKNDKKVDVDYCPVGNVRKPAGAKPGMVVYENYRTVTVAPTEEEK